MRFAVLVISLFLPFTSFAGVMPKVIPNKIRTSSLLNLSTKFEAHFIGYFVDVENKKMNPKKMAVIRYRGNAEFKDIVTGAVTTQKAEVKIYLNAKEHEKPWSVVLFIENKVAGDIYYIYESRAKDAFEFSSGSFSNIEASASLKKYTYIYLPGDTDLSHWDEKTLEKGSSQMSFEAIVF